MTDTSRLTYAYRSMILALGAIAVNITLGHWVKFTMHWPLFLDSIGTILVGALLGPLPGAAIGAISNILWFGLLRNGTILPYTVVAAFIGWGAGFAASYRAFERL